MKFQSDKKELWRYASKNLQMPANVTIRQSPLQHRHPHQRHPQQFLRDRIILTTTRPYPNVHVSNNLSTESSSSMGRSVSTPPPPYNSTTDMSNKYSQILMDRYVGDYSQEGVEQIIAVEDTFSISNSTLANKCEMNVVRMPLAIRKDGYSIVNTGDVIFDNRYVKLNDMTNSSSNSSHTSCSSTYLPASGLYQKGSRPQRKGVQTSTVPLTPPPTSNTTMTASFAATAAKILRNCCGGGFGGSICGDNNASTCSSSSSSSSSITTTILEPQRHSSTGQIIQQPEQYFTALMKHLKASQITLLLKAVKMRQDPLQLIHHQHHHHHQLHQHHHHHHCYQKTTTTTTSSSSSQNPSTPVLQTNCILIRRALIMGVEPHMIACCLFFWGDLKNLSELKRLPVCPSDNDPIYVCCNPLHWFRIMQTAENFQDEKRVPQNDSNNGFDINSGNNLCSMSNNENTSIIKENNCNHCARISETLTTISTSIITTTTMTTDDTDCNVKWCEIAYWELTQRVGKRYSANCPTVQIYCEVPQAAEETHKTGMCLKDLFETPASSDVEHARQKIGLGITLSEESDGVWLYNRSTVPIFIHSPTLIESRLKVCRIEPGDCIRAFEKYRAQNLAYPFGESGAQTGPIDIFSMRISFGKGWGYSYKRLDITCCPCWLEVLFTPLR